MNIHSVSSEQMRKIDDLAIRHFGIDILQLMENAGRNVAELARQALKNPEHKQIVVLAGKGNNGGDGLVAARFLHNWGAKVDVIVPDHPDNLSQITKEQSGILRSMYVPLLYMTDLIKFELLFKKADLIIDGLLGYNIHGPPTGACADVINLANNSGRKILAIDMPSGLNPDTGEVYEPCIKAKYTLTLALPKKGLLEKQAEPAVGELYVCDIGVPNEVYQLIGLSVPNVFGKREIVKI